MGRLANLATGGPSGTGYENYSHGRNTAAESRTGKADGSRFPSCGVNVEHDAGVGHPYADQARGQFVHQVYAQLYAEKEDAPGEAVQLAVVGRNLTADKLRTIPLGHALVTELGQPGLVRHGLRHTALSWMADAGVDLHNLQRVAGHQDPAVTAATCIPMCRPCWRLVQRFRPGGP